MWDFSISRTLGIMGKTMPYVALRLVIFFMITVAYIAFTGLGAGVGYGVGNVFAEGEDAAGFAFYGGAAGLVLVSTVVYWIREYILYIVKAGHIAVIVKHLDGQPLPGGKGQIAYGRKIVTARFAEASVLFGVDQLIKGAIRLITGLLGGISALIPIPGLQGLVGFANTVIRMSLTYVDEILLGYNMRIDSDNPYDSAQDAIVLYAQNARLMIKNAVWLSLFLWVLTFVVFLLMLAPAAAVVYYFLGATGGWSFVLAIVFAWALRAALLEPFAIAALMSVYFQAIEGQIPDAEWRKKLNGASDQFSELGRKARGYFAPGGDAPQSATT